VTDHLAEMLFAALEPRIRAIIRDEIAHVQLERRWLTTEQAASVLGITPAAVRKRHTRGQLPGNYVGRRLFIDMEAFERQLAG
jgi:hypothetical protein